MPTVGGPGTGIGTTVYTVLTVVALLQKIPNSIRVLLGIDTTIVAIPFWLFQHE